MIKINAREMSPRVYNLGKREASIAATRNRILEAARELLANDANASDLSLEAIAHRADVSRLTIYYQFGSRPGLLEALYDHLANRGSMRHMAEVFHERNPQKALEKMVRTFVRFWSSDPIVIRRVRGMSVVDAEIEAGVRARDRRRRHIAGEIVKRFHPQQLEPSVVEQQSLAADVLSTLTSFETYDSLAGAGHDDETIIRMLLSLAERAAAPE
jgi:AcrR family transcriptional regulator